MRTILYFQATSKTNSDEKLAGVREIAARSHWIVQVIEGLPQKKRLRSLLEFWEPYGVIVECGGTSATVDPKVFGALPVVLFDHDPSCLPKDALCVSHDSNATGEMAARELLLGGAVAFAYVPFPEKRFWSDERQRGFTTALELNGHPCSVFSGKSSPKDPTRYQLSLREFLKKLPKPCALFAANDATANEVLVAAALAGVNVPGELSVLGVDNAPSLCEHSTPTLSSIKPDFRRGGVLAALMLLSYDKIKNGPQKSKRQTFGPLEVIRRASTRPFAVHDKFVTQALDMIRKEACSGLKAAKVLALFPTSRRTAERRFHSETGRTVLEEIHAVRLERAKQLLQSGDIPLKALADFCGFKTPNALKKFFLKSTGMTMSAWRRQGVRRSSGS